MFFFALRMGEGGEVWREREEKGKRKRGKLYLGLFLLVIVLRQVSL